MSDKETHSNLHSIVENKQVFPWILHNLVAKISYKKSYIRRCTGLILAWYRKVVLLLVAKEDLESSTVNC